jgi:hypothetical protein
MEYIGTNQIFSPDCQNLIHINQRIEPRPLFDLTKILAHCQLTVNNEKL